MSVINVSNLSRIFHVTSGFFHKHKEEVVALNSVNILINEGETFGLLGPNGAGKTTLTKILTTVLLPTSGSAKIWGYDIHTEYMQIRHRIGFVFGGDRGLYWRLSGKENLEYFANVYRVPPKLSQMRIIKLLDMVGLSTRSNERVENYSRGMKQRLHIARGLINDPDLLFLDEPTIGLDPIGAREIRKLLLDLKKAGKTIFLTSHYMHEVELLCDRVAIIKDGNILCEGTPGSIKSLVSDLDILEIECLDLESSTIEQLRQDSRVINIDTYIQDQSHYLVIQSAKNTDLVVEVLSLLKNARIKKVNSRQPTLEDAYIRIIGEGKSNYFNR